jgi:aryl-alcohol dehydrogenase-like predicted oxidoreductase
VQNKYNLGDRSAEPVLDECEREGIGFIPWFPLNTGRLAEAGGPLDAVASRHDASPAQLALAWLLHRSPVMLPIPGTSKVDHLEDNLKAAAIELSGEEVAALEQAGQR